MSAGTSSGISTGTTGYDRYPTRSNVTIGLEPRHDPVVWGDTRGRCTGPLSSAAIDAFETDGFLSVASLVDGDVVSDLQAELATLRADPKVIEDERSVLEPDGDDVRSIFEVHAISPAFAALVADPRLLGPVRQILGSDVYIHQSRVNFKPGYNGQEFYWHSDFETWHAEDGMPAPRAISVSLSLTENFEFNGPLMVMPGSHKSFVCCPGETPPDHYRSSLRRQVIGTPDEDSLALLAERHGIRQITGPAGSAVFFDSNCMHGSGSNITPYPRSNVFVVYNSVENALVEPFGAARRRPTFIANRDFRPI